MHSYLRLIIIIAYKAQLNFTINQNNANRFFFDIFK